ncbi:MAG: hypothetical protein QNJ98_14230 [Planctomycetota bacterium]|nr:hypothetical protein [Planctomycetota bacterium]
MSVSPTPSLPAPTSERTSPALAVTGFLMLLALFINANPYFGQERMWPWELFDIGMASAFVQAEILVWAFAGLWALGMAFTGAVRLRATVIAGLALAIVLQSARTDSGVRVERFFLNDMIPLIGLGTGLLLVLRPGSRGLGRLVCAGSAIAFAWAFLVGFDGAELTPRYALFLDDLQVAFTGGNYSSAQYAYAWYYLVPQLVLFVVAGLALLAALGLTKRTFVWVCFGLMVASIAAPVPVRVIGAITGGDPDVARVGSALFISLVGDGVLIWLLGTVALADLGRSQEAVA